MTKIQLIIMLFNFFSCFLEWEPSLGSFIGPVGFLVLLNFFFFLRISCVIRGSKGLLHTLEETQELHVTNIDMTIPDHSRIETASLHSDTSTKSSTSSLMDFERRPITQLRALVAILLLFIVTWFCGAIVVAKPFSSLIPHPYEEMVFSYLYGILCAIFGLFMLIYYCLTRKDSRTSWKRFFLCEQQTVYDMNGSVPNHMPQANGHVSTESEPDLSMGNKVKVAVTNHVKKIPDDISSVSLVESKPPSVIDDTLLITSMQESVPSFYNPKQNGVAKKFWEKKNKHNSKLLSKEMTKNFNESGTESNFSGSERPSVTGQGYLSDSTHGNTNFTQASSDILTDSGPPVHMIQPPSYSTVISNNMPMYSVIQQNRNVSSPLNVNSGYTSPVVISGHMSPAVNSGYTSPAVNGYTSPTVNSGHMSPTVNISNGGVNSVSYTNPQFVSHHQRSSSSSSLGVHNRSSAFSVVPPKNNTLPRQGRTTSPMNSGKILNNVTEHESEQKLGDSDGLQRPGDFDGQSQVSSSFSHEQQRSQQPSDMYLSGYSSPPDGYSANEGSMYKQYGPVDRVPNGSAFNNIVKPNTSRNRTNSGGYSSDNSNRNKRKLDNSFMKELEQRVPQGNNGNYIISDRVTGKPPMSPMSDSDTSRFVTPDSDSQIHFKKYRYNDSDHNSEPASQSHSRHSKSRSAHKHSSKYRGLQKQRSLDWDEEFKNKPRSKAVPYAFVNHNYKDRVMQKLTAKAMSENIDPKSRAFWVPRSSSGYSDIVAEENKRLCEDSTSSSSDDDDSSLDNVWVLQKPAKSSKDKKETSV